MALTIALIGLLLSFIFAGSETAFITTNKIRFELWLRNKRKSAEKAEKYFRQPDLFISTILVGNNIANIAASSYATVYLIQYWDETIVWAVITFNLLLFGEIIPKVLFRKFAHSIVLIAMYPIRFFHFILNPVIWLANSTASLVLNIFGINFERVKLFFSKEDVLILMNEGKAEGVIEDEEHRIISKVLELPETLVREAMIPRTQMEAVNDKTSISKLRTLMSEKGFTKIPVYKEHIDNVIGIVFMYDLFSDVQNIKEIIKPVAYTPENKKCNELLQEFKKSNISVAVVIDEYGGTAGLVTTEDLVEELLGEIDETTQSGINSIKKINKITWLIDATESIEVINDQLNLDLPEDDYETISGLILSQLGRIPVVGEQMVMQRCRIVIANAANNRIESVRIIKRN